MSHIHSAVTYYLTGVQPEYCTGTSRNANLKSRILQSVSSSHQRYLAIIRSFWFDYSGIQSSKSARISNREPSLRSRTLRYLLISRAREKGGPEYEWLDYTGRAHRCRTYIRPWRIILQGSNPNTGTSRNANLKSRILQSVSSSHQRGLAMIRSFWFNYAGIKSSKSARISNREPCDRGHCDIFSSVAREKRVAQSRGHCYFWTTTGFKVPVTRLKTLQYDAEATYVYVQYLGAT